MKFNPAVKSVKLGEIVAALPINGNSSVAAEKRSALEKCIVFLTSNSFITLKLRCVRESTDQADAIGSANSEGVVVYYEVLLSKTRKHMSELMVRKLLDVCLERALWPRPSR